MNILDDLSARFNTFVSGVKQNFDLGKIGQEATQVLTRVAPKLTPATDLASRFAQFTGPAPYSQVPQFTMPKVNIPNMPNINWEDLSNKFSSYLGSASKQMVDETNRARQYGMYMPSMAAPTLAQNLVTAYKPQLEGFKPYGIPVGKAVEGVVNFLGVPEDVQAIYKKFQAGQPLSKDEVAALQNHETMTMMGMVTPGATAKEQALNKLGGLMHYGEDLLRRGFTKSQVDAIGYKEAMKILDEGITPLAHSTAPLRTKTFTEFAQWARDIYNTEGPLSQTKVYGKAKSIINEALRIGDTVTAQEFQKVYDPTPLANKVNIWDRFRTPEYVLQKFGIKKEVDAVRAALDAYHTDLPKEIDQITKWSSMVPKESNSRIFAWLDGVHVNLNPAETKVAGEIRNYLNTWADKLGLKKYERISNYITHIYDIGSVQQEFDENLAKIIDPKIAKSVYDPFLLHRTGQRIDYIKDTWRALDAYTKRAVRKYYMDPALEQLSSKEGSLELSQWKYVKNIVDKINLRPTELDTQIDNAIKVSPIGYKFGQRPTTALTNKYRQIIFRGGLGFNVGSALRNLTQGVNTLAEIGPRWTATGYTNLMKNWTTGELERVGVLSDSFIQDRSLSAVKSAIEKADKGLFLLFETAEKVNRGAAYFGAKAQAISKGMTQDAAIDFAKGIVRKTQFAFGPLDTPEVLQSDIMKTLFQFGSYPLKQMEFLANKAGNKEWGSLLTYIGATFVTATAFQKMFGLNWSLSSLLPIPGVSPLLQTIKAGGEVALGDEQTKAKGWKGLENAAWLLAPGGVQIHKTIQGANALKQGASTTATGLVRYPVQSDPISAAKALVMGQYSSPEARDYFNANQTPLSKKQSEQFKAMHDAGVDPTAYYNEIQQARDEAKKLKDTLATYKQTGALPVTTGASTMIPPGGTTGFSLSGSLQDTSKTAADKATVKQLLQSGIPEDKVAAMAQGQGINYEQTKAAIIQDLPVSQRAQYVIQELGTTKDFAGTFTQLAKQKILTSTVVDQMVDLGKINSAQAKTLKAQISAASGKPAVTRASKSISVRKPTVSYKKPKRITFKAPKLKLVAAKRMKLKPMKVTIKKIRTTFPRKLRYT